MSHKTTIFMIDDDIDDQEIFSMVMKKVDATAVCKFAKDGTDALQQLKDDSFTPTVIFLDINMPKMDGMECLAELKKIPRLENIPVYMYSTAAEGGVAETCRELGAAGFIRKQIDTAVLRTELKSIIEKL